jgi:hypothetical protein
MTVTNVTTLTVQPDGWDQMMENTKAANKIMEKYGARNARLLLPVAGAEASGIVHSVFETDDLATLGKILDSIYADADMQALMRKGAETTSWTSSILMDLPLS